MENVTDKFNAQVLTLSTPSKDIMCSSSKQVVAAPASLTSAEKLNLSSDMAPIIEVVTENECSSTQEYQQHGDSINAPKEQQMEFEVQVMNKTVENLLSDDKYLKEGETLKVMTKQVMCPSTASESDVSLIALAQENDGDRVIMQQNDISQEDINVDESAVIATIESEPKPFECTNIILVTDSTPTGAECQIVETEDVEAKISTDNSSCENSSQTNSSSIVLKSQGSEEPLSSQWSLHVTNEGESTVSLEGNSNSEQIEKTVTKAKSNSEETYIAVVKDNENTGLVSVQDSDVQSDEGLTAETLIAISILQNSVAPMNSECQESESKAERQVSLEKVVEQPPQSVENSKQTTGIEIGVQANDYEIERRSGKVPARRRVIPFKFRDYRNPDLVEQVNDSDSDYCPSDNEVRPPKRRRIASTVGPTGRRPGRPRKVCPEVLQKQTGSTVNTASSTNTHPEKSVQQLPQTNSIAQVMTSSVTTSTSEKRTEKSSSPNSSGKNNYACKICQHSFTQKGNLKVHMRVHTGEKPFLCTIKGCSKRFRNNESLRRHHLTHLGIKPFACELCENKFSSKVSLQEHMAIHSNSKPHVCHLCHLPFRQISCLRRHLITHSTEKPFECNNCGQKFSQMVYLKSHSKVHTGERPFVCDHCKRGFAHQSDLIRHRIIHTGKKPFACHICHAKFSDPSSKRRHVKEHMGAKPYSCHLCKDSFKRAGQLKVHLTSKHANHIDSIQTVKQTQSGQTLQFAFKDADKLSSIAIDDNSSAYHKKIAQIVEGLTGSEVTHIATPVNVEDVILQDVTDSVTIEEHASEGSQTVAQVVASAMQSAGMTSITACNESQLSAICQATDIQEGESGYPDQITATIMEEDIPSLIESTSDGATVITIVSLEDVEQEQECIEHTEYTQQFIENVKGDNEEPHFVEVHYEQNEETIKEELATESQTLVESEKSEYTADFVSKPDFSSQEYYDWLSNFTEVCKALSLPLNPDLFYKISQVHKTLSDVMATPSGVIADKENFQILMNISRDLHFIISEHLTYVLQNLDGEKNADDH